MATNTPVTLRAVTVSRLLAKAGVPRVALSRSGVPQCSGFEVNQCGTLAAEVRWYNLAFARDEQARERGLGQCGTALKALGFTTQRDAERLIVTRQAEEG
jgi:hypothetical protein